MVNLSPPFLLVSKVPAVIASRLTLAFLVACLSGVTLHAASAHRQLAHAELFTSGEPENARPNHPTEGGYMLMGGSDDVDAAFRWFLNKAGNGRIVVLRASGDDDYHDYLMKDLHGAASVETIVFHSREASVDPEVLQRIRNADGIFLAGGDQALYLRFWQGTPVNEALDAHVRAHKPIGGTSAGLAVLGQHVYGCLDDISLLPETALHHPTGPEVTLVSDFLHLPGLENVITDTHFSARHRLGRLLVFILRLQQERPDTAIIGIGVDEKTALCVEPDGTAQVFTQGNGLAWRVTSPRVALHDGTPLSLEGAVAQGYRPGQTLHLQGPSWGKPDVVQRLRVLKGELEVLP